jgi:hypothetical protein
MALCTEITINEFIANPFPTVDEYGAGLFFDWFCREKSLRNKALGMIPMLKFLVENNVINGNTTRVIFKNNCPFDGNLYDDLRVIDIESDEMIMGVAPKLGYEGMKGKCEFWKFDEDRNVVQTTFDNVKAFKAAVKNGEVIV